MEPAQSSLASELIVPLAMLACTAIITLIGFLLSRQMKQIDTEISENRRETREVKEEVQDMRVAWAAQFGKPPAKRHSGFKVSDGDSA